MYERADVSSTPYSQAALLCDSMPLWGSARGGGVRSCRGWVSNHTTLIFSTSAGEGGKIYGYEKLNCSKTWLLDNFDYCPTSWSYLSHQPGDLCEKSYSRVFLSILVDVCYYRNNGHSVSILSVRLNYKCYIWTKMVCRNSDKFAINATTVMKSPFLDLYSCLQVWWQIISKYITIIVFYSILPPSFTDKYNMYKLSMIMKP